MYFFDPYSTIVGLDFVVLQQQSSNLNMHRNDEEGLLKHRCLDPIPRLSESAGHGWGLRMCMSNKFQMSLLVLIWEHTLRTTGLDAGREERQPILLH